MVLIEKRCIEVSKSEGSLVRVHTGSASETRRKRKTGKTDMYTQIGTTLEYRGAMTDKDRRELACEKVHIASQTSALSLDDDGEPLDYLDPHHMPTVTASEVHMGCFHLDIR